ncbi:MAG: histidine--tRNA ligase [Planctomycetota bacterium]|nr:histidine--tRNA ligase [Planctomycetota bacterium]
MRGPTPRCVRGFRDIFAGDILLKQRILDTVREVYERYGFVPLETPAVEFVDVLGKFLPESATPEGGIFAFRNPDISRNAAPDDPDHWLALRYDLTAPLARIVAQYKELPTPYRRYQIGTVWRYEKPGPGRFREFTQFDFDSVGVAGMAADAEACCVICDAMEALGFDASEYIVNVNDRKIMQGVLEVCGLEDVDISVESSRAATVLRAIDKLDRLGLDGVVELLGKGRKDETGDFTAGAELSDDQIATIREYLSAKLESRTHVCDRLLELVKSSEIGREGVEELREIDRYLTELGYDEDRVVFDPTVVRGLGYYTGPVFESVLTREIKDEKGRPRQFGSVYGGGRYDTLVERFTGQRVPATGASVGVDRLLEAVRLLEKDAPAATADVLVTAFEADRMAEYLRLTQRLREGGIRAETYLGKGALGRQLKYANRLGYRLAVIIGGDEFARGEAQIKDLHLGKKLAETVSSRDEWRKGQPAQFAVPLDELPRRIRTMLDEP